MKNIYLIITLFIILSCANNDITVPDKNIKNIKSSPDERFMGTYSRIAYYSSDRDWYKYIDYSFTNQNRYIYYSAETIYGFRKDPITLMYEWKKEGDVYYSKLWDNQFSDWKVFNLKYIDENTISVNDKEYTK